ncbi:complex I subunit 5 family protein [Neoroseomonas oryzicola]|uniref:NADH-quinone oxidoreductase subunit J n=1 Tax=Neoroseomonas oryzicola TaxID=535904 RepID=A0A9X9WCD1_9PROT|nr:proton-conducting transporter membrane subunit [Neoroseomonas oryzicola]MBR0657991.1 NADH-quinone oxidoreductase subunit J [Neoroseomonas oryzicola]NKE20072.1 NADH-quinone oxidoreductase subunit J [Neoroseomonas oryzicola]
MSAGMLPVLAVMLPVLGMVLALPLGARGAERLTLALAPLGLAVAVAIAVVVYGGSAPIRHELGHWAPPLGLAFRVDGLSAAMMVTAAVVIGATALFARGQFGTAAGEAETRRAFAFWPLLLAIWGATNLALAANDLFTFYVALELLTFAAMPMVALDGKRETLEAALRYLMFALLGSVLYLLGVALMYGAAGTLDVVVLASRAGGTYPVLLAAALMTAGLLAKTALLPLHLWLPPAHAGAPAAASAVLSALVVKGSFVILLRLWFGVLPGIPGPMAAQILAGLGAAAILLGSVAALAQERLKLLVAYSTVAQIGYLFLMFPLIASMPGTETAAKAWTGGVVQAVAHAFAKAAMFLTVGLMAARLGHDRIRDIAGAGRALPVPMITFGLAGLTLMGVPPSGGFAAKWLLLAAAIEAGQWWWALVILCGGLLTGGYVYRVLSVGLRAGEATAPTRSADGQGIALVLAIVSVLLGFLPLGAFGLVQIGRLDLGP